jgi:purine-binding chemotaxis protein CheW
MASALQAQQEIAIDDAAAVISTQYLTFFMSGEEYGVDILCVQEIRGWENATPLPNSPPHIRGVINLRGTIVPIIDLRLCFGLAATEYTPVTVVIVLKIQTEKGSRVVGIVVDAVSDVYTLAPSDMRAVPDLGNGVDTRYVKSLVTVNGRMVILLDMAPLLALDDTAESAQEEDNL